MHFHAEHSLFFERRQSVRKVALTLGLTLLVLVVNAGAKDTIVSLGGSGVGALLLLNAFVRGHRRIEPAFAWTLALVALVLVGSTVLQADLSLFVEFGVRVLCGVVWVLWLGTQMDWASLRQFLLAAWVPQNIVSTLDHAIMHGFLTRREWVCRRNAARLRAGASYLSLSSWARLLGEGAMQAFIRLDRLEETALIRLSPMLDTSKREAIYLDEVSAKRGEQVVLKELDLRVDSGEWVLVCGPSGAGKSSFLRLLAGLDAPSEGTMTRFGNSVPAGVALKGRLDGRVALLTQNPEHHFIASTVAEDIAWGLLRRGVDADEARRRSVEMARSLGVEHLLDRPCHDLSFGEQRRVALAGLLVLEPALLLLDEPTAGLDPVAAHELRKIVQSLVRQTGASCVWATHDLHSPPARADRVLLLKDGRVIFDGPKHEGLSAPWMLRAGLAVAEGEEG